MNPPSTVAFHLLSDDFEQHRIIVMNRSSKLPKLPHDNLGHPALSPLCHESIRVIGWTYRRLMVMDPDRITSRPVVSYP